MQARDWPMTYDLILALVCIAFAAMLASATVSAFDLRRLIRLNRSKL